MRISGKMNKACEFRTIRRKMHHKEVGDVVAAGLINEEICVLNATLPLSRARAKGGAQRGAKRGGAGRGHKECTAQG